MASGHRKAKKTSGSVLGLAELELIFHIAALPELCCVGTQKGAAHTPAFWLRLSSAGTAAMLSLQHSPLACGLGVGKTLAGAIARTADPADQRDVPHHRMSAQQ